jgi:hypothetical protein
MSLRLEYFDYYQPDLNRGHDAGAPLPFSKRLARQVIYFANEYYMQFDSTQQKPHGISSNVAAAWLYYLPMLFRQEQEY